MGKNLGDDLREGKATLPLIMAMQLGTTSQRDLIREAIETGAVTQLLEVVVDIVRQTGALDAAHDARHRKRNAPIAAAQGLPRQSIHRGFDTIGQSATGTEALSFSIVFQPTGCSLAW
jgi:octaprenyl-diphosphate synthase